MYIINVGDYMVFNKEGNVVKIYPNRCLSASFDGKGIESDTIIWEGKNYNPYDYKYEDGDFILEPIVDNTQELQAELAELKQKLNDTDYVVIKIAEGVASVDDYKEVITSRSLWRERINEIESALS